jgi:uncharacterized SAM-binding protein YcdF (DUF218 family)
MSSCPSQRGQHGGILVNFIVLLSFVLLCGIIYLARHPLLRYGAEYWIVEDPIETADAIIILSDDNFYADRATHAAELFRQGKAPLVVASGKRLRPNAGIAELMEHDFLERGIPRDKIIVFAHDADNTKEEAQALAQLVVQRRWQSVIVVTSNYHTRRTRYIFERIFPKGIDVRIASAPDGDFDPSKWWEKRKSIKLFTHELEGMLVTIWELRGRSESRPASQSVVELPGLKLLFVV